MSQDSTASIVAALRKGSTAAFVVVFKTYYADLVQFAGTFIPEREACEDIVQTVFLRIWEDRGSLNVDRSLKSFLLKAVQNLCLDELRHRRSCQKYSAEAMLPAVALSSLDTEHYVLFSELRDNYRRALARMPAEEREVFSLSRIHGKKYAEIASLLGVSVRTVEVRMSKALRHLHVLLRDYLKLIISIIIFNTFLS